MGGALPIRHDTEDDELLRFIEQGRGRTGKSVEIPAPEGRTQGGWVAVQNLKVQPEVYTMLDQMREHPLFRGKWKTTSQVAWSMIYLGLQACYELFKDREDLKDFRSNYLAAATVALSQEQTRKQNALIDAAKGLKNQIHSALNKNTPFGKYKAWTVLDKALKIRDMVEDIAAFDKSMRVGVPSETSSLVYDNRSGEYWDKLVPTDRESTAECGASLAAVESW